MKGFFITFEGIEGSGKSSLARMSAEHLSSLGYSLVLTREPGGTPLGEMIRKILLDPEGEPMTPLTELLLYFADRAEHIGKTILPSLKDGKVVICDRFSDSTIAYQGYGRGLDMETILELDRIAREGLTPDLTILLDLDVESGLRRNQAARKFDRFEAEDLEFHEKVRNGYREIARKSPERVRLVDASLPLETVWDQVREVLESFVQDQTCRTDLSGNR